MNAPSYRDYYAILGVPRTADEKEIKAAYKKLARKYHPDLNPGDKSAEEKFKEIGEAHDILGDPEKRAKYDRFGDQWKQVSQAGYGPFHPAAQGGAAEFDLGAFGLKDLFESLFTDRGKTAGSKAAGEDIEFGLNLTLEESLRGCTKTLNLTVEDACTTCGGTGMSRNAKGSFDLGGSCRTCRGAGRIRTTQSVDVTIPPGVRDGQRVRVAGKGSAGTSGARGDLYLLVRLAPHPQFERDGADLTVDVPVPYTVAALGGDVKVPTLNGERTLTLPAGVQSGQRVRVAGQGLPGIGGRPAGDLYARIRISVPRDLSRRETELLTELARLRGHSIKR